MGESSPVKVNFTDFVQGTLLASELGVTREISKPLDTKVFFHGQSTICPKTECST